MSPPHPNARKLPPSPQDWLQSSTLQREIDVLYAEDSPASPEGAPSNSPRQASAPPWALEKVTACPEWAASSSVRNFARSTRNPLRCAAALIVGIGISLNPCIAAQAPVTLESLLAEMVDYDAMAKWPVPAYTTHQASSRDMASKTPDDPKGWFGNKDFSVFLRTEAKGEEREYVMMEANGPGCMTRVWYGGKAPTGNLRVYIDGSVDPVLDAPLVGLLSGKGEFANPMAFENAPLDKEKLPGGLNLFFPIPYSRQCRITYVQSDSKVPHHFFYNIEYRTYAAGTEIRSLKREDLKTQKTEIERTAQSLLNPPTAPAGRQVSLERTIAPGQEATLDLPAGTGAVRELKLHLTAANDVPLSEALRNTILKGRFDNEETIWCPVSDFAGAGVGLNELKSWYRSVRTEDGSMTARWVMPYAKSARFTLENLSGKPVTVSLQATVGAWEWDDRSMLFHSHWRSQHGIPTRPYSDWNYTTIEGQGVYMGDTLTIFNPYPPGGWWGEGDEKITVDQAAFPQHFGTGTEDYYCYAWGNCKIFQSPFANQPRVDGFNQRHQNYTVVTRTRNLDRIPFTRHLNFDMEIWSWVKCDMDYAVASYWYARPGAKQNRVPQKEEALTPVRNPDAESAKLAGQDKGPVPAAKEPTKN